MRAGAHLFLQALTAARVDKPRKEEAARVLALPMGKECLRLTSTAPQVRR